MLVEADVFTDGHDAVVAEMLYRYEGERDWRVVPMEFRLNDHWAASFRVEKLGRYQYTVRGWTDPFITWRRDLVKRRDAAQDLSIDLQIGAAILGAEIADYESAMRARVPPPRDEWVVTWERTLEVVVDPVRARFSSWYEMFPRSFGGLRGMLKVLPYVERLGFNVLYLPPIHPIGTTNRKGKNNAVSAEAGDVGPRASPTSARRREVRVDALVVQFMSVSPFESERLRNVTSIGMGPRARAVPGPAHVGARRRKRLESLVGSVPIGVGRLRRRRADGCQRVGTLPKRWHRARAGRAGRVRFDAGCRASSCGPRGSFA